MEKEPDEVVELGHDTAYMYHGADESEPPENEAEADAQQDALEDYIPDDDSGDDSDEGEGEE